MKSLDLFSCIGCHALGFERAGIETVALCESDPWRREVLRRNFPGLPIHDDVRTIEPPQAEVCFGGPPCAATSVAAAIHGKRTNHSLWPDMLRAGLDARAKWFCVEQPPGNPDWEATVSRDLARRGFHVGRFEFGAGDLGAPYPRRRVYMVAGPSLKRLEIAWRSAPAAVARVKRAAAERGDWNEGQLAAIPMDARSAGDMDAGPRSAERRRWIEALGDSNPPQMAEVIGHIILEAECP